MTNNDKIDAPATSATAADAGPQSQTASEHGAAMLKQLGPSLAKRGVPETSYVMVNLANGAFVTGKTKAETEQRFESLHPGAEGWMQLVGDVIGVSLAADAAGDAEPGSETAGDDAPAETAAPRNTPSSRWGARRGSPRG